jgi:hypothetical protein
MRLIKKNQNQKFNFQSKQGKIGLAEVVGATAAILVVGAYGSLLVLIPMKLGKQETGYKTYNSIAISNGTETRVDNIEADEACKDDYKVVYQNGDMLLVYVYDDDPSKRYLKTEFVERNIYVIEQEDGTYKIEFNKENLTDEKYLEFINDLEKNNEDNIQRKRS